QPRTVTSPPTGSLPASACSTLTVVMPPAILKVNRKFTGEGQTPRPAAYNDAMAIELAPAALERIRGYLAADPQALGLRFGVRRTGCSGWGYLAELAREQGAG